MILWFVFFYLGFLPVPLYQGPMDREFAVGSVPKRFRLYQFIGFNGNIFVGTVCFLFDLDAKLHYQLDYDTKKLSRGYGNKNRK